MVIQINWNNLFDNCSIYDMAMKRTQGTDFKHQLNKPTNEFSIQRRHRVSTTTLQR